LSSFFDAITLAYSHIISGLGLGLNDNTLTLVVVILKELLVVLEKVTPVLLLAHIFLLKLKIKIIISSTYLASIYQPHAKLEVYGVLGFWGSDTEDEDEVPVPA
jgi:hypothetical protein